MGWPQYFPKGGGIIELELAKRTDIFYPPLWQKMSLSLDFYIFYKHLPLEGISCVAGKFFLSFLGKQN